MPLFFHCITLVKQASNQPETLMKSNLITFAAIIAITVLFAGGCKTTATNSASNSSSADLFSSAEEEQIFNTVQQATFQYFWDCADTVTSGGSGFGIMAILVGVERKYITREQALERLERNVSWLEKADRFHGVFPHWWVGETGKVKPFSRRDDGGDLVETSFLMQGLLCVRQYFANGNEREKALAQRIDKLWKEVEFDWYTHGQNVLYWHWSPQHEWAMNFAVHGYNECLIMYILAAASPTHGVKPEVYHEGWALNGDISKNPPSYKGITMELRQQGDAPHGGPLFWAHYSYLGLDPRNLKDRYADYWKQNVAHAKINYQWCVDNPKGFKGYGPDSWGLTSSYAVKGYAGHAPDEKRDLGTIAPTAALSSFPYTPKESMAAMKNWYSNYRQKLFGVYGFYDAFNETENFFPPRYLAIDQGPIVVMMENYRSGLLWKLFMSCKEVQSGLDKLGFTY